MTLVVGNLVKSLSADGAVVFVFSRMYLHVPLEAGFESKAFIAQVTRETDSRRFLLERHLSRRLNQDLLQEKKEKKKIIVIDQCS